MRLVKWQYAALTVGFFFLIKACLMFSFHYYHNGIIFLPIWGYIHIKKSSETCFFSCKCAEELLFAHD